jgi:P27 family predicted phage terminase small subunit
MGDRMTRHRNPKLLEAEGAYRKNPSRRPTRELQVTEGVPEPTPIIAASEVMTDLWYQTCDILTSLGIVNQTDKYLLESYCINYAIALDLSAKVMKFGHTQDTATGKKRSPDSQALQAHMDRHIKLLAELGLTPSSRARFVSPVDQDNPSNPLLDVMKNLRD